MNAGWPIAAALALCMAVHAKGHAQVDENVMKAAFVYNFIQLTEWPSRPEDPFRLCILGQTPLDEPLQRLAGKDVLSGLRMRVRRIELRESAFDCHAVYIDDSQRSQAEALLRRLEGTPVLTVTDSSGLAAKGAMIEIHKRDTRLGFEVNLVPARKVNMQFSSRMLKLATFVAGSP